MWTSTNDSHQFESGNTEVPKYYYMYNKIIYGGPPPTVRSQRFALAETNLGTYIKTFVITISILKSKIKMLPLVVGA